MTESSADVATVRRARQRLDRIDEVRSGQRLAAAGRSEQEIADLLHTTEPRVRRMLGAVNRFGTETPEEIILRATVDASEREVLVARLCEFKYTFRKHAPRPFEGATSGSWDDVKHAYVTGLLSHAEVRVVAESVARPLAERVAHSMALEGQPVPEAVVDQIASETAATLLAGADDGILSERPWD